MTQHPPFLPNTRFEPGDRFVDGGWEAADGVAIPETTAPECDRTCLSCQGGDHPSCGMDCHLTD